MATILLGAAGSAIGASVGGSFLGVTGAAWGRAIGASIGGVIDQRLSGPGNSVVENGKIESFRLQSSVEGGAIGRTYGRNRLAGQVIWASDFYEDVSSSTTDGGKFNTQPTVTTQTYSYSVSLALALCEGEIVKVGRVWADGEEVNRGDLPMTVYTGHPDQAPDPTIASVEGVDFTPAYRNTAYVVFDNLQLAQFGNRVPQFNFEVFRRAAPDGGRSVSVNDEIAGVALMPGSGEYVLATTPVSYSSDFATYNAANINTNRGQADIVHALEDLRTDLPNCKSVLLVTSWFGNDLRCSNCEIRPAVEQKDVATDVMPWSVSGVDREHALQVSQEEERPVFGGTPCDASVVEAISEINSGGQGVVFYPFIMMDIQQGNQLPDPWNTQAEQSVIPWRGRITASIAPGLDGTPDKTGAIHSEVDTFFGNASVDDFAIVDGKVVYSGVEEWSYRRFVLHYAFLCTLGGGVEAFCIGSELRGLTQLRDENNGFPVVAQLVQLASDVRQVLGAQAKIGYAADWSEYFGYQPADGSGDLFFHLDPLWASDDVDFIGIDNYMPLSDWRDEADHLDGESGQIYDQDYLKANVEGGEGFDWYYANSHDRAIQKRTEITDGAYDEPWVYRYKDIRSWWQNWHFNRINGVRQAIGTDWKPESKPIWFTEYGFPAVDKGTNQPNVFIDPKSSESAAPYFSNLEHDPQIQRSGIEALLGYWNDDDLNPTSSVYGGKMIDMNHAHVWAWDARPWPDFPLREDVWSDGLNYELGHWLSGRMGGDTLGQVVAEICEFAGVKEYDVSGLNKIIDGLWIKGGETARDALQALMSAYEFSCAEVEGVLVFSELNPVVQHTINRSDMVVDEAEGAYSITRNSDEAIFERVSFGFWNPDQNYQYTQLEARKGDAPRPSLSRVELPLVLRRSEASKIVERFLSEQSMSREAIQFALPLSDTKVSVSDVLEFDQTELEGRFRVQSVEEHGFRSVEAVRIRPHTISPKGVSNETALPVDVIAPNPVYAAFLDLPKLSASASGVGPYVACTATPWPGGVAFFGSDGDDGYELDHLVRRQAVFGRTLADFPRTNPHRWSEISLDVALVSGSLSSVSEAALLGGANLAAVRGQNSEEWEIVQFMTAGLNPDGTYQIRRFLRGQYGTDSFIPDVHEAGAEFVLLDASVSQMAADKSDFAGERSVRFGPSNLSLSNENFRDHALVYRGIGLRPFAPAHLSARKEVSGGVNLSWIRRTRDVGDYWAAHDVPLGETSEKYLVSVSKDGQMLRQFESTNSFVVYSRADQLSDGAMGEIDIDVAQISEIYGSGPSTRITVHV